jgi:predicted nucleic acid-binding protein
VTTAPNLAAVIDEAQRISAAHTLSGGHRSFDILHAAAAVRLEAERFLTFDRRQKELAEILGLTVPI